MKQSKKWRLNQADLMKWLKNTLLFSSPAILAVLVALSGSISQGHLFPTRVDLTFALGAGYSAMLGSLIDLFRKFSAGK